MTLSYAELERQLFLKHRPVYDSSMYVQTCTHTHQWLKTQNTDELLDDK